jgi:phage gp29-like protein
MQAKTIIKPTKATQSHRKSSTMSVELFSHTASKPTSSVSDQRMTKIFIDAEQSDDAAAAAAHSFPHTEDTFDTLGASRYSFFSPAILQKFLSISL